MKADGTKLRMELTNVSAELKTANTQLCAQKTDIEKLKKDQVDLTKEVADTKEEMNKQMEMDQASKDSKDSIIQKLRTLAKKYKGTVLSTNSRLQFFSMKGL